MVVRNKDLLHRLDAHLDRGNHLMAEQTRVFAEQANALRLLIKEIQEFGREMAAQRQALFRILDKLD